MVAGIFFQTLPPFPVPTILMLITILVPFFNPDINIYIYEPNANIINKNIKYITILLVKINQSISFQIT